VSATNPSHFRVLVEKLRPYYDGPSTWLWFVGAARIWMLLVVAAGIVLLSRPVSFSLFLALIFLAAFVSSLWYFIVLIREHTVSALVTWTQVLVDISVVAATISFTGGQQSFFTFLFVLVILEAGVLMGLLQGFVFATLASAFMLFQAIISVAEAADPIMHWYNFLIQGIAFFFTAFISGYWNQRVSRMKQFQREILDNMNSGFLITDNKGLVTAINQAACTILGRDERDVAGLHVDGVIRPVSGAECPITTALRSNKDYSSYEFYAERGDGAAILLGLTTNRIHDLQGKVTGLIASFTDLTEMARMRQELQKQDRMAVIGELSAGLAHEIRNPVASIRSAVEELRNNMSNTRMVDRLASIAVRESDHLNEIVDGFLDFARDPDDTRELVDVRTLVRELESGLERQYGDQDGLQLAVTTPDAPCMVHGNTTQLRQVFQNLAQNAVEAMDGSGALRIRIDHGGGPLEIQFSDEGPGIEPDKVARIFEPFYTGKSGGVGMGLAICMRIITAHNGTIEVASGPGGGTTMCVRLPAAEPAAHEPAESP